MGSQGIQGHDIVPIGVWRDYGKFFIDYLPGFSNAGEYNLTARASTQLIAAQLDIPMHSGPHPWLNEAVKDLLSKFDKFPDGTLVDEGTKTIRITSSNTKENNGERIWFGA